MITELIFAVPLNVENYEKLQIGPNSLNCVNFNISKLISHRYECFAYFALTAFGSLNAISN